MSREELINTLQTLLWENEETKMKELRSQGKTMVFVSHSMGQVKQLCDRAIWLHEGHIKEDGNVNEVVEHYLKETA